MCTSCALALDRVDDGDKCVALGTWHGCECAGSISPDVRVGTCTVAFLIRCSHTCGETRVDMFVGEITLHVWD